MTTPPAPTDRTERFRIPRRAAAAVVTTVTALLLVFRFDAATSPDAAAVDAASTTDLARSSSSGQASPAPTTGAAATTPAGQTVAGDAVRTRFGTVQVQITVEGGTIVDVTALALPSGGRDSEVSSYAEPILRSEALAAQSAQIDTVSGATYTSAGYIESLQSAIDQAGL